MKIAVSSKGTDLDSPVDPRFGRAAHILLVDSKTMAFKPIDNSANAQALKGAGIQAARMISDNGAEVLLTGHCGPNAFTALKAAGIKVANEADGSVRSAVAAYLSGTLRDSDAPNAQGGW